MSVVFFHSRKKACIFGLWLPEGDGNTGFVPAGWLLKSLCLCKCKWIKFRRAFKATAAWMALINTTQSCEHRWNSTRLLHHMYWFQWWASHESRLASKILWETRSKFFQLKTHSNRVGQKILIEMDDWAIAWGCSWYYIRVSNFKRCHKEHFVNYSHNFKEKQLWKVN